MPCARLTDLLTDEPTPDRLALALNMSRALLLGNLSAHSPSFSQLLDHTCEAQALVLLAEPTLSLKQIASRLELSSASILARAHSVAGATPPRSPIAA